MDHAADEILGIAACSEADRVGWAMYPPARTALVATARAHYLLSGEDAVERLRRLLNQELAGNWSTRQMALAENTKLLASCDRVELRIKDDGDHVGLIWRAGKSGPPHFKATTGQPNHESSPTETALSKLLMSQIPGMDDQMKALSYRRLSEVIHDRPRRGGFNDISPGRSLTRDLREEVLTTSTHKIAKNTVMVARAFEIAGSKLIQHCGGDPNPFKQDLARAVADWLRFAFADTGGSIVNSWQPGAVKKA
ncbi:hypothetical protein [Prescottella equi]|uniref:hypothetical protein n=1 Tax=Rhodococcus hoagii TaxID=43767 RepID=UPI00111C123D|nr:hypothetical protein [Prescottella equi]